METVAYRLRITLVDMPHPVWRELLVPADASLHRLHRVLQAAMPWDNAHLYRFEVNGVAYTDPLYDPDGELGMQDSRRARLRDVASPGTRFLYIYDFGDRWEHDIAVEEALTLPAADLPICVAGEGASPPEDAGGPRGYLASRTILLLQDPDDPEYEATRTWYGSFDPFAFDLDAVNRRLRPWQHWPAHPPTGEEPDHALWGLRLGEADEDFLEWIEDTRSAATARTYWRVLQLFTAFLADERGLESWPKVQSSDFDQYFATFLPRKVRPSETEARSHLSVLKRFVGWLDATYGTRLDQAYRPAYDAYRSALPRVCRFVRVMDRLYLQERFGHLLDRRQATLSAEFPALRWRAEDRRETRLVEGYWWVAEVEGQSAVLAAIHVDDGGDAGPPDPVTVTVSEEAARHLRVGDQLSLALAFRAGGWTIKEVFVAYPAPDEPTKDT